MNSMVFYESFASAIKRLPEDEQLKALWAIIEYGLYGSEPNEDGLFMIAYDMARPQIDANTKRRESSKMGGRPKKQKPMVLENKNHRLEQIKTNGYENEKPNVNVNANVNANANVNVKEKHEKEKPPYTAVFEELWKAYPRRKDKALAYKAYKARLNDGFSEDELITAVKRYAEECRRQRTEERYIKHCSTFLGVNTPFMDYLKKEEEDDEPENSCSVRLW